MCLLMRLLNLVCIGHMLVVVCRTKSSKCLYWITNVNKIIMSRKITKRFGVKVRTERVRQGLSQEKLATKAGVHRTYIGMIERAEKNILILMLPAPTICPLFCGGACCYINRKRL